MSWPSTTLAALFSLQLVAVAVAAAVMLGVVAAVPRADCVWPGNHEAQHQSVCRDPAYSWGGRYPACALFQRADLTPVPCSGEISADYCVFEGARATITPPQPASWHIHVFFPNPDCPNCTAGFSTESEGFTYAGAMRYRRLISHQLNVIAGSILGRVVDPINASRAQVDPAYNQCGDEYHIVAGAPANFHAEPCIFEVDDVMKGGPFTDPATLEGYPNYSFLIPGEAWLPGLLVRMTSWLADARAKPGGYGRYDVLIHPNTGCEARDHVEARSITWMGTPHPLRASIFSCHALGCNQACPSPAVPCLMAPPANCTSHSQDDRIVPGPSETQILKSE